MRIQSSHLLEDRGLDAYWTPPEAALSLLHIEEQNIPQRLWEPAAGIGSIMKPFFASGYDIIGTDIFDYEPKDISIATPIDYLKEPCLSGIEGIITNPPFKLALQFARKAISEVNYVALLLRTNFLESIERLPFFRDWPPSRVWISSRRLPMMHRFEWNGPEASSNTCFAWFIWERPLNRCEIDWFDWADYSISLSSTDRTIEELGL